MSASADRKFLERAFALARRVSPRATSPNPRVGCVLVKGGRIVAEGAHLGFGKAHAELNALARAGKRA
ncbi:MAG: bifunctional diaminohydroxyphosphoribosylaminopyrimidine deaminase/5-amino-6-(5-phosphoribosylamino)uracil reductase, partial [Elusimicrobia bacterium]|nr:bifunctional diaminohydroxyphosphoribosylaminopyrimidine deaminase/5-amino-6-(5-phosphoribosylamino)uracil reductase [Elusimicrobiota bacterium]